MANAWQKVNGFHLTFLSHFWKRLWAFEHSNKCLEMTVKGALYLTTADGNPTSPNCALALAAVQTAPYPLRKSVSTGFIPQPSVLSCGITEWFAIIIIIVKLSFTPV